MVENITDKYRDLVAQLSTFNSIGVAYSGGVDSTLVSWAACEAIGPGRVVLLHGASPLLPPAVTNAAQELIRRQFSKDVSFRILTFDPLLDERFIRNDASRCYVCKRLIYTQLLQACDEDGLEVLLDGTNCDDLADDRPGHQAIAELGIKTPLVQAGFTKAEIRKTAAALGLVNAELPSNSCLATRLRRDTAIDRELLQGVDAMESFLHDRGFSGCRVRPRGDQVLLEIRESDFSSLADRNQRNDIVKYFNSRGYAAILLDLQGRS